MPAWSVFESLSADFREGRLQGRGVAGFKERFLLWFQAADPGLVRFRLALQVLLALGIGTAAAIFLLGAIGWPSRIGALAGILAMNSTMMVQDLQPGPRLALVGRLVLIAAASAVLAALLQSRAPLAYIGFVGIMVAGAWMQRWGRNGMAMAMAAFMAYFNVLFVKAGPAQVPSILVSVAIGYGALLLVTFVLVRNRDQVRARRLVPGLLSRITQTVEAAGRAARQGSLSGAQQMLVDANGRVQEVALMIDSALDRPEVRAGVADPVRLRGHVLAAEHLTDHFVAAVLRALRVGDIAIRERLATHLQTVRWTPLGLNDEPPTTAELIPPHVANTADRIRELYHRLAAAMASIEYAARKPVQGREIQELPGLPPREQAAATPGPPATTGKVIQVALAGTLSILIGAQLSETYWYWATIGAFFTILTTQSRGASVRKAIERIIGTAFGVLGGAGLAVVLKGSSGIELLLIALFVLIGFWFVKSSHMVMMLSFTVMVALLYDVMGVYSLQLLLVRLWETIVGAGLGALAALVILPVRTRKTFDDQLARTLESVESVLTSLDPRLQPSPPPVAIYGKLRELDRAISAAREAGRMLTLGLRKGIVRRAWRDIVLMASLRFRVRELAAAATGPDGRLAPVCLEAVDALDVIKRRTAQIRTQIHEPDALIQTFAWSPDEEAALQAAPGRAGDALKSLNEALDAFVESRVLAAELGSSRADE